MASNKEKVIKIVDITALVVVSAITAINACSAVLNKQPIDFAGLSYALLFAIALHFILTNFNELDMIKNHQELSSKLEVATSKIINSLSGVEIKLFDNIDAVDGYVADRILKAKKCVFDLNWQDYLKSNPNPRNPVDRQHTENSIDKSIKAFCKAKESRVYREIFTFSNPKNFGKMLAHIEYGAKYNCSYFESLANPKFPKLQFVVVDDEEVIFVSSAYRPNFCAIKDKRVVSIFIEYFNQAWDLSDMIKTNQDTNTDLIAKIRTDYNITL